MNKLLSILSITLLVALLLSSSGAFAQNTPAPSAAAAPADKIPNASTDSNSRKARQLLDEMISALGGEAWLTYRNSLQQGRSYSFYHGKPTSAGTLFWRYYEYPDKERRELTKQRDVVYIYNGDKGFQKTYKGTALEEDKSVKEVIRRRQHSLEVVVREWLKEPQTVLLYEGQKVADQQLVDVVTILNKNDDQLSIGIDANTHLPINKRFVWRDADKYRVVDETVYGNYRKVQGIETPYTITSKRDGEITGQSFLSHVEYNTTIEPGFFDAKVTYNPRTHVGDGDNATWEEKQ